MFPIIRDQLLNFLLFPRDFGSTSRVIVECRLRHLRIEFIETPENVRRHYQYFTEATMGRLQGLGYAGQLTSLEDGVRKYVTELQR